MSLRWFQFLVQFADQIKVFRLINHISLKISLFIVKYFAFGRTKVINTAVHGIIRRVKRKMTSLSVYGSLVPPMSCSVKCKRQIKQEQDSFDYLPRGARVSVRTDCQVCCCLTTCWRYYCVLHISRQVNHDALSFQMSDLKTWKEPY